MMPVSLLCRSSRSQPARSYEERLDLRLGRTGGIAVTLHHVALGVDEELGGEVPSHVAGVLLLEELPHRVGLAAVDVDLGHHVDADAAEVELVLDELLNLGLAAGFLRPELVAREAHNLESLGTELLGHRGHLLVVAAGRASLTRHVGHEDNLALELVEGHVVAVDVLGAEVVERFGGGHGNGGGATDGAGGGHSAGAKLGLNDRGASGERGDGLHHTGVERSGGVAEIKFDATCSHTLACWAPRFRAGLAPLRGARPG
mmetsp:Transcript_9622/g.43669  ORF Transcript_9622/g.43669 Transcript_9622/m.43669 type:complete len:259 (-) Transcript_9622:1533-2309(-)